MQKTNRKCNQCLPSMAAMLRLSEICQNHDEEIATEIQMFSATNKSDESDIISDIIQTF